ncbi:hypothetical protein L6452_34714 [Arctium lappa]|uniref:Uncharacterized protein n=1 Tax=Arctium lappa TaxID=4217 RepID=A0ACB8YK58_ARCLA|nr:hypothetical protein L6452_34714 [Arctium lappa]
METTKAVNALLEVHNYSVDDQIYEMRLAANDVKEVIETVVAKIYPTNMPPPASKGKMKVGETSCAKEASKKARFEDFDDKDDGMLDGSSDSVNPRSYES